VVVLVVVLVVVVVGPCVVLVVVVAMVLLEDSAGGSVGFDAEEFPNNGSEVLKFSSGSSMKEELILTS